MIHGRYYDDYEDRNRSRRFSNSETDRSSIHCLDYMLKAVCNFMEMLERGAESDEELDLIKEYAKKIGEM